MARVSQSVQFRDRGDVIEAYRDRGLPAFAIYCGNQFFFDYSGSDIEEGAEMLRTLLDRLFKNKSAAIYTLCVYKEKVIPEDGIDSETPYHGSFNFRLKDEVYGYETGEDARLRKRIEELEAKLKEAEEYEDEELPMEQTMMGKVEAVLNHPMLQPLIQPLVERIAGFIVPPKNEPGQIDDEVKVRAIRGIPAVVNSDQERIDEAIRILYESVGDLPDVLEKLARMSVKHPFQFKMYMVGLRAMKI